MSCATPPRQRHGVDISTHVHCTQLWSRAWFSATFVEAGVHGKTDNKHSFQDMEQSRRKHLGRYVNAHKSLSLLFTGLESQFNQHATAGATEQPSYLSSSKSARQ